MENEKRVIAVKAIKKRGHKDVDEFFEQAKNLSRDYPGEVVKIEVSEIGGRYNGKVSKINETDAIALLLDTDQSEEFSDEYGQFANLKTLKEITDNNYEARVIGCGKNGSYIIIEVEEFGEKIAEDVEKDSSDEIENTLLSEGILTTDGLEERTKLLKTYGINRDDTLYHKVLKAIRKQSTGEVEKPKTIYKKTGTINVIKRMLAHIVCGHSVILEGPKSVGKNVAWETIAYILNCKIIMLQCDGKMTKSTMFGHSSTDNESKGKLTKDGANALMNTLINRQISDEAVEFIKDMSQNMSPTLKLSPGPVTKALLSANEGQGTILLLDEMNLSDPNTLSGAFNALTDRHTKSIFINDLGEVPVPDKLIIGATQNCLGGNYLGTKQQNDATMSRFVCLSIQDSNSISHLLRQVDVSVDPDVITTLDKIYSAFADQVLNGVSESCLNVRGFKAALESIALGMEVSEAVEDCVINTVPVVDDRETLKQEVDNYIMKEY